jgi:nucleotide-binding universal stress UspA family protein
MREIAGLYFPQLKPDWRMVMFKSILVPIDLAHRDVGQAMIKRAVALSDDNATITLLHVIGDIPAYAQSYLPEGQLQQNLEETRETLKALADSIDVKADVVVRYGSPSPVILDEADERDSDLIIIASHHPGIKDYLIGSTASRVVRHADCSVLINR